MRDTRNREQELLELAREVIDKLVDHLDDYYGANEGSRWVDEDGGPKPLRDWMHLKCFGQDHELYDAIMAFWGMYGRKTRK